MCRKLCHFIWGIWWFHWSKDFEAMKAGMLAIRSWLFCQHNENTLMDLPSSMPTSMFSWSTEPSFTSVMSAWKSWNIKSLKILINFSTYQLKCKINQCIFIRQNLVKPHFCAMHWSMEYGLTFGLIYGNKR